MMIEVQSLYIGIIESGEIGIPMGRTPELCIP